MQHIIEKMKNRLRAIGAQTGTEHLFANIDDVLSNVLDKNVREKKEEENTIIVNLTPDEVNRRFGNSFLKEYVPALNAVLKGNLNIEFSDSNKENVINGILQMRETYLGDEDFEYVLRPIEYSIHDGSVALRSESNRYGLIANTQVRGDILDRKFWTNGPTYENPGRLKKDFKANPYGIGLPNPNETQFFYYLVITFQKAYPQ